MVHWRRPHYVIRCMWTEVVAGWYVEWYPDCWQLINWQGVGVFVRGLQEVSFVSEVGKEYSPRTRSKWILIKGVYLI